MASKHLLNRIGRLALAGAALIALAIPASARPITTTLSLFDNLGLPMPNLGAGLPFPIPGAGGGMLTIPIPIPGGGTLPIGISLPGQGYYQSGYAPGGFTLPIPLPGGGSMPVPIAFPGDQGGNGYPYPTQTGYMPGPPNGYFPNQSGYRPEVDHDGHNHPASAGRVQGYDTITYHGHPCAVGHEDLPLRVYSENPSMNHIVKQAAATWNEAGQRMGGVKFVEVVDRNSSGAIAIDWTGRGMPQGAAGLTTMMKSQAGVRVTGIGLNPMRGAPERKMVEVLSHEMGHALGLDHSDDGNDLMYRSTRPMSARGQMLSARDFTMLQWLYSQQDAVPIVASR